MNVRKHSLRSSNHILFKVQCCYVPNYWERYLIFLLILTLYPKAVCSPRMPNACSYQCANRTDPEPTASKERSDLGLHYLLMHFFPNIKCINGTSRSACVLFPSNYMISNLVKYYK